MSSLGKHVNEPDMAASRTMLLYIGEVQGHFSAVDVRIDTA